MAKKNDIKNKSEQELSTSLAEKRQALKTFRFDISGSKIRNVRQGRGTRKEVARLLTELNMRKKAAR